MIYLVEEQNYESFSGNVDATITQTIKIGVNPQVTFKEQPTSADDPNYALTTSTTQKNYIYNATATFNKAVNMSHADSEGESIKLFGQTFTVAAATDVDTLVLLKSAEKVSLDSDNPTADVTVDGETYTIELISSSDSAATIAVTDSAGTTESKEINEAASKTVNGITVAVTTADETNLKLSASVVAGSDKFTFEDGSSVTQGSDNTVVDGTLVKMVGDPTAMTSFVVSVHAPESDNDAIKEGETFTDPVFGSFKLDFSGFNIGSDTATMADVTSRETISILPNSDDKMDVTFTNHQGYEATITWAKNGTKSLNLHRDDDYRNISVLEMKNLSYQDYVIIGNEDEGHLLRISSVKNQSSGYSNDVCKFTDVFSGEVLETVWTAGGTGTVTIGGKSHDVTMHGVSTGASEDYRVQVGYADTTGADDAIIYPTIETSKGAKIAFYEPLTIDLNAWDGTGSNLANLKFPDGDGYTTVSVNVHNDTDYWWNFSETSAGLGAGIFLNGTIVDDSGSTHITENFDDTITIGQLTYNITNGGAVNTTTIYLLEVDGSGNIMYPAMIIFEEKDDNNEYQAMIVELEAGGTGDDGLGVDSIEDTFSNAAAAWKGTRETNNKLEDRGDLWGSIMTKDTSDSDQPSVTISYPDEQIYAQIHIAEESAAITPGGVPGTGGGQVLIVKDSEVGTVASKNLVVIGGSCVNTVAAKILGVSDVTCTSAFTDATGVGAGQYLIKTVMASEAVTGGSESKVAMLVAGYSAADTVNAVATAKDSVDSTAGTEQVYPIASA